jgi:glycosyltransferase involved in cell wall biosynthesis
VHDYLTQRGGAERVALAICRAFPEARVITSVYDPERTFPEFRDFAIETSYLQRFPLFRRDVRLALPLLSDAFNRLHADDVDVVICSTTGWAHGIQTDAAKLVYCHNPARWIYQPDDYGKNQSLAVRATMRLLRRRLRAWDQQAAATATRYLVNSTVVRARVLRSYGIEADVLPPPVGIDVEAPQDAPNGIEPGYFLVVGRARGYKNVEVVCNAFRELPDQRLIVVGGLPDEGRPWPANVAGLVGVPDAELRWLYANCRAVIAAAHEDFGLTPLEGNAFGRPALVLRAGGFLDTMVEGVTGHFIETLDVNAVIETVRTSLETGLDNRAILEHAARYSTEAFQAELDREVQATLLAHAVRMRAQQSVRDQKRTSPTTPPTTTDT